MNANPISFENQFIFKSKPISLETDLISMETNSVSLEIQPVSLELEPDSIPLKSTSSSLDDKFLNSHISSLARRVKKEVCEMKDLKSISRPKPLPKPKVDSLYAKCPRKFCIQSDVYCIQYAIENGDYCLEHSKAKAEELMNKMALRADDEFLTNPSLNPPSEDCKLTSETVEKLTILEKIDKYIAIESQKAKSNMCQTAADWSLLFSLMRALDKNNGKVPEKSKEQLEAEKKAQQIVKAYIADQNKHPGERLDDCLKPNIGKIDPYDKDYNIGEFIRLYTLPIIEMHHVFEMAAYASRVYAYVSYGKGMSVVKTSCENGLDMIGGYTGMQVRIRTDPDMSNDKVPFIGMKDLIHKWGFGFLMYDRANYMPLHIDSKHEKAFNLFHGFIGEMIEDSEITDEDKDDFQFILDHILNQLCSGDPLWYEYFLNFLAYPIQRPNEKITKVLVLSSIQGTGKSMFLNLYQEHVIGRLHSVTVNGMKDVITRFNNLTFGKAVTVINNVSNMRNAQAAYNYFKSKITKILQKFEKKFCDAQNMNDFCAYIILTNTIGAILCDEYDRQYAFCPVLNEKQSQAYYDRLAGLTGLKPELIQKAMKMGRMLYHHLKRHNIRYDMTDINNIPPSKLKFDLINSQISSEKRFISEVLKGLYDPYEKIELLRGVYERAQESSNLMTRLSKTVSSKMLVACRTKRRVGKNALHAVFLDLWCSEYSERPSKDINGLVQFNNEIELSICIQPGGGECTMTRDHIKSWTLPEIKQYTLKAIENKPAVKDVTKVDFIKKFLKENTVESDTLRKLIELINHKIEHNNNS